MAASSNSVPAGAALERLFELSVRLTDAMDAGLAAWGMTRARAEVIWRLRDARPMTQRELSQALQCTPRNVTDLVDALEAAGLVARGPHPTDRRATLVRPTDAGGVAAARMRDGYAKLGADLFAGVLDATLARLAGPPAAGATDGPR